MGGEREGGGRSGWRGENTVIYHSYYLLLPGIVLQHHLDRDGVGDHLQVLLVLHRVPGQYLGDLHS